MSEPVAVLLHGIGHRLQAWRWVETRLRGFECVALDLPGFGAAPLPPGGLWRGVPDLVTALKEILDGLGLSRPHIVGNSLGGAIALELGAAGRAASVTALSPAGFAGPAGTRRALRLIRAQRMFARAPGSLTDLLLRSGPTRSVLMSLQVARPYRLDPEDIAADAAALAGAPGFDAVAHALVGYAFTPERAARIDVPVTVAWAARDRILPPDQALVARRVLPAAEHVLLPGCGHLSMYDDPGLVADTVKASVARGA